MAKIKETKVALKGEKPKKAPKASDTARKAPPRSEEIVVESDSDESGSGSSSGHSSGSESDAEKRKNTKKPKASKVKKTEPSSPPVPDDSDSSDKKAKVKKSPAAVDSNGTALKTEGSSEDSSSENESEGDESEEEQKPAEASKVAGQADTSETTTAAAIIPPQPFTAPPGYKPLDTKTANTSTISSIFDPKSLSSKQVWHITAPSSVPLSDIKSVSLSAIQTHQPVLSHKGTDYNFTEEPSTNARVMIPSSKAEGYVAVDVQVTKMLHLQQTVRLPSISSKQTNPVTGSNAAAEVNMPSNRGPRPQPKGLKMRYKPPGFGSGDAGTIGESDSEAESDVDMVDAPTTKPTPAASKRKRDEKDAAEASPRKDKKRRKAEEAAKKAEEKLVAGTKAEAPETVEETERKRREKKDKKKKDKLK